MLSRGLSKCVFRSIRIIFIQITHSKHKSVIKIMTSGHYNYLEGSNHAGLGEEGKGVFCPTWPVFAPNAQFLLKMTSFATLPFSSHGMTKSSWPASFKILDRKRRETKVKRVL